MATSGAELEEQLKEAGNRLLDPPPSVDELLNWLDELEQLLINVEQEPSKTMQDALLPPMKALISSELLRHCDSKVKISVASCLSEITRITAPDAPYNDEQMKEIFELTVAAFGKLSHVASQSYGKAVSILETVAKIRSCLVMLDLELDELVLDMFRHFLKIMRFHHQPTVYTAMETIMILVIHESEEISSDLLTLLLSTVRKEFQSQSPMTWKLGTKVLIKCAAILEPYLKEAVRSGHIALDEYGSVVTSICQEECHGSRRVGVTEELSPNDVLLAESETALIKNAERIGCPSKALESCSFMQHSRIGRGQSSAEIETKLETESETDSKRRGWKPNSLMNPDEGYDRSWIATGWKSGNQPRGSKPSKNVTDDSFGASPILTKRSLCGYIDSTRARSMKRESSQDVNPSSLQSRMVIAGACAVHRSGKSDSSNVKKKSRDRNKLEPEQKKRLRKNGIVVHNGDGASTSPESHKTAEIQVESHETLPDQLIKIVPTKKNRSLVQTDDKSSPVITTSQEHAAEASYDKKTKSLKRNKIDNVETPKAVKRKRTPRKEVASEIPDLGEDLIGCRIKVWWPMDKTFYEGIVASYDPAKKKHLVLYEDGDEEVLNLRRQRWELIGKLNQLNEGHDTDLPKTKESSDVLKKGRRKSTLKSPDHGKPGLPSRRGGADHISRVKSGRGKKSADGSRLSRPIIVDDATMDDMAGPVAGSKDAGERSRVKVGIKSSSAGMNKADGGVESGRGAPESGTPSNTGDGGNELSSGDSRSEGEYFLN